MKFSDKIKDDVHEVLMNLNRGRLAVSQAHEQIFDILEQPSTPEVTVTDEILLDKVGEIVLNTSELNMMNYSEDQVSSLNQSMRDIYELMSDRLLEIKRSKLTGK